MVILHSKMSKAFLRDFPQKRKVHTVLCQREKLDVRPTVTDYIKVQVHDLMDSVLV